MSKDMSHLGGWIDDPKAVEEAMKTLPFPVVGDCNQAIKDTGRGKTVLLYKYVEEILGSFNIRLQAIGDCVSFGAAGAIDCLKAFEIKRLGQSEEWVAETSTEDIYGGSRVVVGNGRLGNGDGSLGVWAAKWVSEYGTLVRKDYGEFDLTTYSGPRAKSWGYRGFPKNEVMKYCKEYPVQTVSRVSTYEEARDLLANGYPVTIAGTLGFSNIRDEDGFSRPSGSWAHMMFLAAVDDVGVDCKGGRHRPGVLVINSWGKWNGGPKRLGQPDGSFWISPEDLNRYFRNGDCWAYSDFKGYESKKINTWII